MPEQPDKAVLPESQSGPTPDDVPEIPECSICRRQRTIGGPDHPMDAYDYTPMQVITGQPVGWYSGDDGEVCPEDMAKMLAVQ